MRPPGTFADLDALLDAGVLIDLAGRPLRRRPCAGCGGVDLGTTCPQSIPCPTCSWWAECGNLGRPGRPCGRPSGHQASRLHTSRVRAAAAIDDAREAADDPTLPARWEHQPGTGRGHPTHQ